MTTNHPNHYALDVRLQKRVLRRLHRATLRAKAKQHHEAAETLAESASEAQRELLYTKRRARAAHLIRSFLRGQAYLSVEEHNKLSTIPPMVVMVDYWDHRLSHGEQEALRNWVTTK